MNYLMPGLLYLFSVNFNYRPALRKYLSSSDGWINFAIGFQGSPEDKGWALSFLNGKVKVMRGIPQDVDVKLISVQGRLLREMITSAHHELLNLILQNKLIIDGNISYLQLFNYYTSLLMNNLQQNKMAKSQRPNKINSKSKESTSCRENDMNTSFYNRRKESLKGTREDPGVKWLQDPYLGEYNIDHFPRLQKKLDRHFNEKPQLCTERPKLLTEWFRREGLEFDRDGNPWNPELRQAEAFYYLMSKRQPIIDDDDLLAGTSTSKLPTGVIVYPDAQGTMIWGELNSIENRPLNPYSISSEDKDILHDVFAFWAEHNFREWVRNTADKPLCQLIEERWVCYFVWKSVGISHTVPDFAKVLREGTTGIISEINAELEKLELPNENLDGYAPSTSPSSNSPLTNNYAEFHSEDNSPPEKQIKVLKSMKTCLEGVNAYANNLSEQATAISLTETDPGRKNELQRIAQICQKVPAYPAETLDEAVNCIWIIWVALHMENTNTGLSLGRLDQLLQPFFEADMASIEEATQRKEYIKYALELIGCLFMRCTDHLPLVPDIGNYLFGGSSSDQAITLGGVTPSGEDAVNDMTYLILKVTEMLTIRDPNVNARFNPRVNTGNYLRRLCEVNYTTAATPSMHNDNAVLASLEQHRYPPEHACDWSATGCVEATISGRHMGHTGSILFNLVAALEMALNNGTHPLMNWELGPLTGRVELDAFQTFDEFFNAFAAQLEYLIAKAVELNHYLAEAHSLYRPTPLLSSLIEGSLQKRQDVTNGGALYNTSGTANIGLADVTDSLMVIKKLIFEEQKISFPRLKEALDRNFSGDDDSYWHTYIQNKVPLFGSGNQEARELASRITGLVHDIYASHQNYRGGPYTTGFWSMSQHVAYGNLSGALPSGRKAGKAFTPGLTPQPVASEDYLNNIRDVASLEPSHMDNNIAFNVKLVPPTNGSREKIVEMMAGYIYGYFKNNGMQMQFNVVNAATLRDAMAKPQHYKNLLVRISGYNAYFVTLNQEMQKELIERAEYKITG